MNSVIHNYTDTNDDMILRDEIQELREIQNSNIERKRDLILTAAQKLSLKYPDTRVICTKLKMLLGRDHVKNTESGKTKVTYAMVSPQYITDVLPPKYKHPNSRRDTNADNTPDNLFEESLLILTKIFDSQSSVTKSMLKSVQKLRHSHNQEDQQAYQDIKDDWEKIITHENLQKTFEYLQKQLSEISNLADFIRLLQEFRATAKSMQSLHDLRQKFSTAMKLNLRLLFLTHSYDHISTKLNGRKHHGGKWMSTIDHSESLQLLEKLIKCPKCGFNSERWKEKFRYNQEAGLPIPEFDSFCR